jgi:hypothetical protein
MMLALVQVKAEAVVARYQSEISERQAGDLAL